MSFLTQDILYTSGDIKREAKAQLAGHWRSAVILMLISSVFAVFFVGSTAQDPMNQSTGADVANILLNGIHGFLVTGASFTLLDFLRRRNEFIDPLRGILQAFDRKYFVNLFVLKIVKYLYIFLWSLLFIIPGILKAYSYSQAELIYKDKVDQTGVQPNARECLKESERLMRGKRLDLFTLHLSFIGWMLLGVLTLGLLLLWLNPYMSMSYVVFYENIVQRNDLKNDFDGDRQKTFQRPLKNPKEEIGQDPDDFRDFRDF